VLPLSREGHKGLERSKPFRILDLLCGCYGYRDYGYSDITPHGLPRDSQTMAQVTGPSRLFQLGEFNFFYQRIVEEVFFIDDRCQGISDCHDLLALISEPSYRSRTSETFACDAHLIAED